MANETVLKYLVDTNRPYSCADITNNLRGAFSKGAVQKALDALSENGKIKCKAYGKQKVYCAPYEEKDDDQIDYDAEIKRITQDLNENRAALKIAEQKLKTLVSAPKMQDARMQIKELKKIIENLTNKVDLLKNSPDMVSVEDKKEILEGHEKWLKEYRNRKRIVNETIEAIMEGGYPKSKKCLLEELGLDTEESVDF